jgi:predicted transcriptional regulator of viral defense system
MGDTIRSVAAWECLFAQASEQHGHFTRRQAQACGFGTDLLTYHARRGRFIRVHRGVYRLRDYPSSPREEVVAAWLALGKEVAVVSHESALDLLGLSDVIPTSIHLTVPRAKRNLPDLAGVTIHTTTRPLRAGDVTVREGVRLTSAARTILDAAQIGTAPEQVQLAVVQAIARGLVTRQQLDAGASERSRRVRCLIAGALPEAPT